MAQDESSRRQATGAIGDPRWRVVWRARPRAGGAHVPKRGEFAAG